MGHIGNVVVERFHLHIGYVLAAYGDASAVYVVEMHEQARERRFARPGFAYEGDHLAFGDVKVRAMDDFFVLVAEMDVLECDVVASALEATRGCLEWRMLQKSFEFLNLVIELGDFPQEAHGFQQRRAY